MARHRQRRAGAAPEDGTSGDELQRRAALALRAAKRGGRGTARRFVPEIQEEHSERRFYRRELEAAIAKEMLEVHYQPVVAAAVTLGHALGMKVLAEGVETDEQRVLLRLAGCDEMQGYLFAKPRPAAAIDKVVARSAAHRSGGKQAS